MYRSSLSLSLSLSVTGLLSLGCVPPGPPIEVPASDTCNEGILPQACKTVPPRRGRPEVIVDGVRGPTEYWGALTLPYVSVTHQLAGGRVYVTLGDDGIAGNSETLHVFFEDAPVAFNATELIVYLDFDRLDSAPAGVSGPDRAVAVGLGSGSVRVLGPSWWLGSATWDSAPAPGDVQGATGGCRDAAGDLFGVVKVCNLELAVELPADPFAVPPRGVLPALGFAAADDGLESALPEELAVPADGDATLLRTRYMTLLFGRPAGIPLSVMSWNVARWGPFEGVLTGSPFAGHVDLDEIAAVIEDHAVVALQELWWRADAEALLELVNARRAARGAGPMELFGPVSPAADLLAVLTSERRFEGHGGVWILSAYPAITGGYDVFDACRGEDCVKAKGVLWVRLQLRPPTPETTRPECQGGDPGLACPAGPSGDVYVDVFATHLQAGGPEICDSEQKLLAFTVQVCGEALPLCAAALQAGFHCGDRTDADVQAAQLEQMGDYIERVLADQSSHFAIVAGDFNINGRKLNRTSSEQLYGRMLSELRMLRASADWHADLPADGITPWPAAFAWDIDHADIAREDFDEELSHGCGLGTSIGYAGADRIPAPRDCNGEVCDLDSDNRLDYILARPARTPGGITAADHPSYLLARAPDPEALYTIRWPTVEDPPTGEDACGGPGSPRLSDHRPVEANLQLVPVREPPRYHPSWPHRFALRVTSVDATGEEDCFLGACNPLDPYAFMSTWRTHVSGDVEVIPPLPYITPECTGWTESYPGDPCMDGWVMSADQVPGLHTQHESGVILRDADETSPDDTYPSCDVANSTAFRGHPLMRIRWDSGVVQARELFDEAATPLTWPGDFVTPNNDPIPFRSSETHPWVTLEMRLDERTP